MKRYLLTLIFILMNINVFAAPYVTNVVAKQRYPWGIVDISCEVCGIEHSIEKYEFSIKSVFADSRVIKAASHVQFRGVENNKDTEGLVAQTNGIYRFVWDANKDLGAGYYGNVTVRVSIYKYHEKVQLWESGPYWATTNIGAEKPEDYGYYFWWGDTVGYKRENGKWVASDGSNSNFLFETAPTYYKITSQLQSEGWITADLVLTLPHDAAQEHWAGNWRMPTRQEFDDLISNCDWTMVSMNGVNGYVVSGKGDYSAKSIFLPCAGYGDGASLSDAGSRGCYWSSCYDSGEWYGFYSWSLNFSSGDHGRKSVVRYYGQCVRPLQGFAK